MPSQYTQDGTAYDVSGKTDGLHLVLIHGLGLSRSVWDGFMPKLTAANHVIRYDLFGHGMSPAPPRPPDLALFSEQIITLMNHLGLKQAVLAGFSLGGMINRRFALDYPHRAAGLIILNSPHERSPDDQDKVESRARMTAQDGIAATIEATIERWFTPDFIRNHPEAVDQTRREVLANRLDVYAACRYVLAAGVTELIRPPIPPAMPALVVTTAHDSGSTPMMSDSIAKELPNSICTIIPDLRHMGLVEQPDVFLEHLIPFLREIPHNSDIS
jgi:pimeloyl-ACP methyl ester carboxylesterase